MQHLKFCDEPLLSVAVEWGDEKTVAALIEAGADVNARDDVRAVQVCMSLWRPPTSRRLSAGWWHCSDERRIP
jgi:hypothetical protein